MRQRRGRLCVERRFRETRLFNPAPHRSAPTLLLRYFFKDHKSVRSMNRGRTDLRLTRSDCSERRVSRRYLIYWIFVFDSALGRRRASARSLRGGARRRPLAYARGAVRFGLRMTAYFLPDIRS